MHFLFKVIILFLIVFNFRLPYVYNSAFLSIALTAAYYIFIKGSISLKFFFQRYVTLILIGTVALSLVTFLIAYLHQTEIMNLSQKRIWIMFLMLGAVVFALPLLIEGKENSAFEEIALIICAAFAIQGIISLAAYLYSPLADLLMTVKPQDVQQTAQDGVLDNRFRYLNLSGVLLVELTAAFGAAFIVFFWLQLRYSHPYMSGWKKFIFFFFIFLGTVLSGRTGFFGLLFGLSGWLIVSFRDVVNAIARNLTYIIGVTAFFAFIYYFAFTGSQRHSFNNEVFPFAFEWYYNYKDYGKFEVNSMEATDLHYYFLSDETLLKGHGVFPFGGESPYPHSDAGYTNTLVYGGIPLLIFIIIYQLLYFFRPITISLKDNRIDTVFFLILLAYLFFVNIKAPAIAYLHIVEVMYIALGAVYVMNYHREKEQSYIDS